MKFRTALCDLLGIEYPIFLAGMGGVSLSSLVAAVSNAGGLGIMGAATLGADQLRDEIRRTRDLTDKPFAVDLLAPLPDRIRPQMETFAQLADHHASMEIAEHLAAITSDGPWLEWFDATGDPISISLVIPEESVARFANRIGRKFERDEGPEKPLPSRKG